MDDLLSLIATFYFSQCFEEITTLREKIGEPSILEQVNDEAALNACDRVADLQIHTVQLSADSEPIVKISLGRPGLLIGKGGNNIEKLESFLKSKMGIQKIEIEEYESASSKIQSFLNYFNHNSI